MQNTRVTGTSYNVAKAFKSKKFGLNRQAKILAATPTASTGCWHMHYDSDYLYASRGSFGVSAIDVSTPGSASESDVVTGTMPIRGSVNIGNTLFTVGRGASGELKSWDITNKAAITNLDTIASATKFSAIATDGTYVYVAGQQTGFYSFNVSTPSAMVQISEITTGSIENQGVCYYNNYVYFANYHYGLRIFDTASGVLGGVTNRDVASPTYNGIQLRLWEVVAEDDYIYASTNVSNFNYNNGGGVERSLLILPISSPTTVTDADWIRAQIPEEDQDVWNVLGDNPYIGIAKQGNYVYMGAGHSGVFVWDVTDPTKPIYKGKKGTLDTNDNIYGVAAWTDAGKDYLAYGDGINLGEGTSQVYIDEVV